jgi:hypothetical protein
MDKPFKPDHCLTDDSFRVRIVLSDDSLAVCLAVALAVAAVVSHADRAGGGRAVGDPRARRGARGAGGYRVRSAAGHHAAPHARPGGKATEKVPGLHSLGLDGARRGVCVCLNYLAAERKVLVGECSAGAITRMQELLLLNMTC